MLDNDDTHHAGPAHADRPRDWLRSIALGSWVLAGFCWLLVLLLVLYLLS